MIDNKDPELLKALGHVPCALCGRGTRRTATERCDRCWELESRMEADLPLAVRILRNILEQHARSHADATAQLMRDAAPNPFKAKCHATALDLEMLATFILENADDVRQGDTRAFERFWLAGGTEEGDAKIAELRMRLMLRYLVRFDDAEGTVSAAAGLALQSMEPDEDRDENGDIINGSDNSDPVSIGRCPRCGTPIYTEEGFCGHCFPERA